LGLGPLSPQTFPMEWFMRVILHVKLPPSTRFGQKRSLRTLIHQLMGSSRTGSLLKDGSRGLVAMNSDLGAATSGTSGRFESRRIVLILVNVDWFLLSHRANLVRALVNDGFDVHVACCDTGKIDEISLLGAKVRPIAISRGLPGVRTVFAECLEVLSVFREIRPDVVHCVGQKMIFFGGIIGRYDKSADFIYAYSGLGFMHREGGIFGPAMRSFVRRSFYRFVMHSSRVWCVFQNSDDLNDVESAWGCSIQKYVLVPGSGVDLVEFAATPLPDGPPNVVCICRIVREKGVREFVRAARIVRNSIPNVRFVLVGGVDRGGGDAIPECEVADWVRHKYIEAVGHKTDVRPYIRAAHVVTLPSYREGFPKILAEAAASGRPVVTTNVPGCRDAIIPDITGRLVPVRDSEALAEAIISLLKNQHVMQDMALQGRIFAENSLGDVSCVTVQVRLYEAIFEQRTLRFR
jgi:glycosyltransferase involved in cell wall biosynthesis